MGVRRICECQEHITLRSVNVICFESCVLYRSGVTLCCVLWGGGWFAKWIVRFPIG